MPIVDEKEIVVFSALALDAHLSSRDVKKGLTIGTTGSGADYECDGTADNTQIQTAIDALPNGGRLFFLDGSYSVSSQLQPKSKISYEGIGNVTITSSISDNDLFSTDTDHYAASSILLTGNATPTNRTSDVAVPQVIAVAATTGLAVGNYIKIMDDALYGTYKNGEICRIEAINGLNITLENPLYDSYTTANNANIRKISMFEDIKFKNINFVGAGATTESGFGAFYGCSGMTFDGCTFTDFGIHAIELIDCLDVDIIRNTFRNVYLTGFGYSVSMVNACDNINIVNNTFTKNGRHYIASGGMVGGTTVVGGLQRNCLIDGNSFYDANQEAVNTHIACRAMMRIVNNKFFRCLKAVELTNASSVIENNIFENCPIPVDLVESAGYHLVQGNQFIGGTKIDLDCECAFKNNLLSGTCYITCGSSGTTYPLEIAGNTFKNYTESGVYCTTTNTGRKVRILNNIYESADGNKYFVRLTGHNNVDITGNTAYGGIQLNTCSGVNISNNTLRSGSSYSAIRLYDASGLHLIKNNVLGATNIAINLDGTGANAQAIKIRQNNITAATAVNNVSNYYSAVDDDAVRI